MNCTFSAPQIITPSKGPFNLKFSGRPPPETRAPAGSTRRARCFAGAGFRRGSLAPVSSFDAPALVTPVAGAVSVSVGNSASCAVAASGRLFCWGDNSFGRLGAGPSLPLGAQRATPIVVSGPQAYASVSVGSRSACARTAAGGVRCWARIQWGSSGSGCQEQGLLRRPWTLLGCCRASWVFGDFHVCSLDPPGVTACWGNDLFGQIGQGGGKILPATAVVPVPVARLLPDTIGPFRTAGSALPL